MGCKVLRGSSLGSSPLARGTPPAISTAQAYLGLIPARAGNTTHSLRGSKPSWAHPRSRGEHVGAAAGAGGAMGSSPLARGTRRFWVPSTLPQWLIPARAGNTRCVDPKCQRTRAHPRSRGEHSPVAPAAKRPLGSSPLARGTLLLLFLVVAGFGLIPARAGNTWKHKAHSRT